MEKNDEFESLLPLSRLAIDPIENYIDKNLIKSKIENNFKKNIKCDSSLIDNSLIVSENTEKENLNYKVSDKIYIEKNYSSSTNANALFNPMNNDNKLKKSLNNLKEVFPIQSVDQFNKKKFDKKNDDNKQKNTLCDMLCLSTTSSLNSTYSNDTSIGSINLIKTVNKNIDCSLKQSLPILTSQSSTTTISSPQAILTPSTTRIVKKPNNDYLYTINKNQPFKGHEKFVPNNSFKYFPNNIQHNLIHNLNYSYSQHHALNQNNSLHQLIDINPNLKSKSPLPNQNFQTNSDSTLQSNYSLKNVNNKNHLKNSNKKYLKLVLFDNQVQMLKNSTNSTASLDDSINSFEAKTNGSIHQTKSRKRRKKEKKKFNKQNLNLLTENSLSTINKTTSLNLYSSFLQKDNQFSSNCFQLNSNIFQPIGQFYSPNDYFYYKMNQNSNEKNLNNYSNNNCNQNLKNQNFIQNYTKKNVQFNKKLAGQFNNFSNENCQVLNQHQFSLNNHNHLINNRIHHNLTQQPNFKLNSTYTNHSTNTYDSTLSFCTTLLTPPQSPAHLIQNTMDNVFSMNKHNNSALISSNSTNHHNFYKKNYQFPPYRQSSFNQHCIEIPTQRPPERPWITLRQPSKHRPSCIFTVMCYNILSDKYATRQAYGYCPNWALSWDYRRKSIMDEIRNYNADIISLQEVETEKFYNFFKPEMEKMGYDGIFSPKSRAKTMSENERKHVDGCAIFYRVSKFTLINEHLMEFNQLAMANAEGSDNMLNRVMTKDNIGLVALLQTKENAFEISGTNTPLIDRLNNSTSVNKNNSNSVNGNTTNSSGSSSFNNQSVNHAQPLLVCTAHMHWDPEFSDVKLIQTMMLIHELRRISQQASTSYREICQIPEGSVDAATSIPLVFCADLNSLPSSAVVEFLSSGTIAADHIDFKEIPYKDCLRKLSTTPENKTHYNHPYKISKAYPDDLMPYTNYTVDFKGVIDYIFYSKAHMSTLGLLGPLDPEWIKDNKIVGCPHPFLPSDHFPLLVEFEMLQQSANNSNNKQQNQLSNGNFLRR